MTPPPSDPFSPTGRDPSEGARPSGPRRDPRPPSGPPLSPAILDPALETALLQAPGVGDATARYRHLGILASGGSGVVHAVEDRVLQRTIAVKRLQDTLRTEVGLAFLREAQTLARLDHPCIIPVYDYGVDSGYRPYIVMKRIEGEDLASWLRAVGPARSRYRQLRVLELVRRVCDAITLAHARDVLHGDLKPSNLMLGDHGEIYVVDWGNAVPRRRWKRGLRAMTGTPAYMSPEQARGEPLSPRTDVFGLGACLYTLLVGRPPRPRDVRTAIAEASQRRPIEPPPDSPVPAGLMQLALRCMAPRPADRPESARALAESLDQARYGTWLAPQVEFSPGDVVVREGQPGDQAYVVESGTLEVHQAGQGRIRDLHPGDVFGEMAPLTGQARSSTVIARTTCTLAVVDGARLRELLDMGSLGGRFVEALARRLRDRERASEE